MTSLGVSTDERELIALMEQAAVLRERLRRLIAELAAADEVAATNLERIATEDPEWEPTRLLQWARAARADAAHCQELRLALDTSPE